jgi:glutamine cyclotransferase
VFYFDGMVRINPDSGYIEEAVDFAPLREAEMQLVQDLGQNANYDWNNNVCNGIAYDPEQDAYFITGKRWNLLFKIKLGAGQQV